MSKQSIELLISLRNKLLWRGHVVGEVFAFVQSHPLVGSPYGPEKRFLIARAFSRPTTSHLTHSRVDARDLTTIGRTRSSRLNVLYTTVSRGFLYSHPASVEGFLRMIGWPRAMPFSQCDKRPAGRHDRVAAICQKWTNRCDHTFGSSLAIEQSNGREPYTDALSHGPQRQRHARHR